MPEVAVMIEGQNGLNWERWKDIARTVEDRGFAGLFRSDHFTNREGPYEDSLELWVSLAWLADNTDRIEFGPLVTPMSFRHPVFAARMGKNVDDLSGGRLVLGVGAGWQEREHETFGFDLLDVPDRFDRFEELNGRLDRLLERGGRRPDEVRRSLMTRVVFGRDEDELDELLDDRDPDDLRDEGVVVGTAADVAAHLDRLDEAGVDRVMLQWLDLDDLDRLGALADAVA